MRRTTLLLAACSLGPMLGCAGMEQRRFESRWLNKPAPDFELTALGGGTVKLSEHKGKPVLLAFWGVGCPPCRAEAPHLSSLVNDPINYPGLVVLAVNSWDEPKQDVARFVKDQQLKQHVLLDGSGVAAQYGVTSVPTVFWINKDGVIVDLEIGFGGAEELKSRTTKLMKK